MGIELPQYRCHKVVRAAKIIGAEMTSTLYVRLRFGPTKEHPLEQFIDVTTNWVLSKAPAGASGPEGCYYVIYDDGYASLSPAAAFESGYTRIGMPDFARSHQQRVVDEKAQLDERRAKLRAFIGSIPYSTLPRIDQRDLGMQLDCMDDLASVLARRIERFGAAA